MNLDPISLKLFIHIVEAGTIAGGAKRLNVVTSAASKRIVELETVLEAQLLRRTNRGVEVTAAGAALENLARRALGNLDDISRQIRDFSQGIRGHVRIFATASAISQTLPSELATFLNLHPQVYVHFEELDSEGIFKGVSENLADIGISLVSPHEHQLQSVLYQNYKIVALVPKGHALTRRKSVKFADTLQFQHVGLRVGSATNLYMSRRAAEMGASIHYRMHVESYYGVALLVEAGLGIGIVPEGVLRSLSSKLRLTTVPLDEGWAARELRIYFPSYERLQAASRLLVDHLRIDQAGPDKAVDTGATTRTDPAGGRRAGKATARQRELGKPKVSFRDR